MVQDHENDYERNYEKAQKNTLSMAVLEALSKVKVNGQNVSKVLIFNFFFLDTRPFFYLLIFLYYL